ncbi:MAG: ATP:cob(I)alamin adenosyltransferase [Spirochaetota bacterium]|jgi:cob(I)alamin adenosyltransferase|nr:ATP:cob(I)alamin adenosyltransferase [Spirochaetota bacterium]
MQKGERRLQAKTKSELADGALLPKSDQRFECIGAIDELSAQLALLSCGLMRVDALYVEAALAELAALSAALAKWENGSQDARAASLDRIRAERDRLFPYARQGFIRFSSCRAAAEVDLARAICRRAERELIRLFAEADDEAANNDLVYLDCLADWLYLFACYLAGSAPPKA